MIKRSIKQLANMIPIKNDISAFQNVMIHGIAFDTRSIKEGNLFVPLVGENADGHDYIEHALRKGAAAVFWQKDKLNPPKNAPVLMVEDTLQSMQELARVYRQELSTKVIAITGSNGKTTTKDITAAIFSTTFNVHKTEGNYNNHIGLPYTILSLEETTEIAILEMGMSGRGEIALLTNIARPDIAIITNIGEAHLQDLGSREAIAEAKLEITEGLSDNHLLIYPGDEPLLSERVVHLSQLRKTTFGESANYDVYPEQIHIDEDGSEFTVNVFSNDSFFLPISGKHNIKNALAAISAAKECSITASAIKAGLRSVTLSHMRMEWHDGVKGTKILNDAYNASPTAMRAVISMVEGMPEDRDKILVLGDMLELGEQEKRYHLEIGKELNVNKIKSVFTYGSLGKYISEGARTNFPDDRVFAFTNKNELIEALLNEIEGNEIVLVKASRGMKMEEVVNALAK